MKPVKGQGHPVLIVRWPKSRDSLTAKNKLLQMESGADSLKRMALYFHEQVKEPERGGQQLMIPGDGSKM